MSKVLTAVGIGLAIIFTAGAAAGGIAAAFAAGGLTSAFANLGLGLVISGLSQALVKRPGAPRPTYDLAYSGTMERRRIWYGELVSAGMHVIGPWTSGDNNKDLHEVQVLAAHQMQGLTDVYLDDELITSASIGAVANNNNSGAVTGNRFEGFLNIRKFLGLSTQTVDYILDQAFSQWTSDHRGRGCAYFALRYRLNDKVWQGGKPEARVKGQGKIIYDPRLDPVSGASPNNASYRVYSNNPILVVVDYLLDTALGCGVPSARIDWDLVEIAANICDETVSIPGSTTQKRYTCNVQIFVAENDDERRDNLSILLSACLGHMYYRGGKYRIYAGSAQLATFALTESNVAGRISVDTDTPTNRRYNYVKGEFIDPLRDWKRMPFQARGDSSYETADLGRYPREISLPCCTSQYEAQRDAIVILRRSRCKIEITGTWDMSCFQVRPGDVGTITLPEWGFDEFQVKCTSWRPLPDWKFEATFLEEISSAWDDPNVGDYTAVTISGSPSPADFIPDDPETFGATRIADGIRFFWDWQEGWPVGGMTRFYIYEVAVGGGFGSAVRVSPNVNAMNWTLPKNDTTERDYYLTAANYLTDEESDPAGPVKAAAASLTTGFRANVTANTVYKKLVGTSSGNSASVTLTPVNGVAPFTYSWTGISGDTSITANSASSATSNFNNTGMTDGEINIRIFRGRITDNTAANADVEVRVTFVRDDGL